MNHAEHNGVPYFPSVLWEVLLADSGPAWTLCRPVCGAATRQPPLYYYSCECASQGKFVCNSPELEALTQVSCGTAVMVCLSLGLSFSKSFLICHLLIVPLSKSKKKGGGGEQREEAATTWLLESPTFTLLSYTAELCAGSTAVASSRCVHCSAPFGLLFTARVNSFQQTETLLF